MPRPDRVGYWWRGCRELAGIDGAWRLHDLRHWSATFALSEGYDLATVADQLASDGVAIRAGHHCAQPVMERFGIPATARASLALYNTREDLDALGRALHRVREVFA